jgi:hypothetical protein
MSKQRVRNFMDATPLDEFLLHHLGCGKIKKIEVPKIITEGAVK